VKRGYQRIDGFEKEHVRDSSSLKDVTAWLEVLEFQISRNVLWAKGLAKQINLMSNGAHVTTTPLPLKNLKSMSIESPSAIIIKTCPTCLSFYACNTIMVLSCGCTYH
jgi:hypothetical protein